MSAEALNQKPRKAQVDGEWALRAETADFISGALQGALVQVCLPGRIKGTLKREPFSTLKGPPNPIPYYVLGWHERYAKP